MEQEPRIKDEQGVAGRVEQPEKDVEKAVELLENPPDGDFVAGLRAFIVWVQSLIGKK